MLESKNKALREDEPAHTARTAAGNSVPQSQSPGTSPDPTTPQNPTGPAKPVNPLKHDQPAQPAVPPARQPTY